MSTCERCGRGAAADASFCAGCGALLTAPAVRGERKVVTVLFADLVGFTERSERLDPEDVRATLSSFHAHLRKELERFGGTVEKFIGDAVMAVFGAPAVHEDDPERAVHSALAIRDWAIAQEGLQLRIGVNTGEALVSAATAAEGMVAGDVVNTAARLQTAAPVNGVLVGERTHRATEAAFDYVAAEPVLAKGKSDPVRVWELVQARSTVGKRTRSGGAELIGRTGELNLLCDLLARVEMESAPQIVTVIGLPGIGKSRLVDEFLLATERVSSRSWLRGRSLAYGNGISFWALGEIVKTHAAIQAEDPADVAEQKLRLAIASAIEDATEARRIADQLRPLVGLGGEVELGGERKGETFGAWRRFFEAAAEQRPLVLVFEDIHLADEGLLEFVDELVEWATASPLLVVATARPELLERRPGWSGGKANSVTISLSPLSHEETGRLIHELLRRSVLPADAREALIERSGGNPLYAEEFARMVSETSEGNVGLPESVQAIIAARLDLLSPQQKSLLLDAAVVGTNFTSSALAALEGLERIEIERRLHELERRGLVRPEWHHVRAPAAEHAFHHMLVRDVAYSLLPRTERADRHARVAAWLESLERPDDHAETIAHHLLAALEYAEAAGQPTEELSTRARLAQRHAGDRAAGLNAFEVATDLYFKALEGWPQADPERALLLLNLGKALMWMGDARGEDILLEASEALRGSGGSEPEAEAEAVLAQLLWMRARPGDALPHAERAVALVAQSPPSRVKAFALTSLAQIELFEGKRSEAIDHAREALSIAELLGIPELSAHALNNIGTARVYRGDLEGISDLERSLEIANDAHSWEALRAYNNLAGAVESLGDRTRGAGLRAEALRTAERFGSRSWVQRHRADLVQTYFWEEGRWDEALALSASLLAGADPPPLQAAAHHTLESVVATARGDDSAALDHAAAAVATAREARGGDPAQMAGALALLATALHEAGMGSDARRVGSELLEIVAEEPNALLAIWPFAAAALARVGLGAQARDLLRGVSSTTWTDAAAHYLDGDYVSAAGIFREQGVGMLEAEARLRAAEALLAEGRRAEADTQLAVALAFYRSAGATRYIRAGEALLAATG